MGEVYRADDLKLGQTVALKFLPAVFEQDPSRLERLLGEVRLARQISHPNVCRVYDVGEADGMHFVSMEYVDGEDLQTGDSLFKLRFRPSVRYVGVRSPSSTHPTPHLEAQFDPGARGLSSGARRASFAGHRLAASNSPQRAHSSLGVAGGLLRVAG